MKLTCIAIDDEPLALKLIRGYAEHFPFLQLIQTFENAVAGAEFLRNNQVDLLFVDIQMPDITGIELVRALKTKPMVIFTTAYKNYAYEGFELEALDYLLKPIDLKRFTKAVEKAADYYKYKSRPADQPESEYIYVNSEYKMVKINVRDIEYIESMEDYIRIHTSSAKPVMTLMPLKKALEILPQDKFIRIHRSYIVSVDKIRSFQSRRVQLTGVELPVSDTYIDNLRRQISN